ncbi:uncharacterized protein LOC101895013 [Musca domestica]|uniref:Uncharacterized protein LOC101895013 n=1 Tax=Musca domestica TaxID=7370 RepID=A0A1I8MCM3_MUSDO|nr:uncharacterized protein LOC101895013 [Musca domestica]
MIQAFYLTIVLTIASTAGERQRTWTYSVQSVICTNETPDVFEMKAEKRFVSRGVYKTSGIMEVKQNLTDAFEVAVDVFYSPEGNKFTRTPFRVLKTSLSDFANSYYIPMYMKSFQNCTHNVPELSSPFHPPLPVCRVTMSQCRVNTENFPSYLRSGYYRMVLSYSGQATGTISVEAQVEQKSNM